MKWKRKPKTKTKNGKKKLKKKLLHQSEVHFVYIFAMMYITKK